MSYIVTVLKQFFSGLVHGLGFYVGITLLSVNQKTWLGKQWTNVFKIQDLLARDNFKEKQSLNNDSKENVIKSNDPIYVAETDYNASVSSSSRSTSIGNECDLSSAPSPVEERAVEMLVHNVSHADMVLSLGGSDMISESTPSPESTNFVLCQPRFSAFDLFSRRILHSAFPVTSVSPEIICFPRYERRETPRYSLVTPRLSRQAKLPIGFHFSKDDNVVPLLHEELPWLRIRGRDSHRVKGLDARIKWYQGKKLENSSPPQSDEAPEKNDKLYIDAVFFPLISTLLAKWEQQYRLLNRKKLKKVVILVSGAGSPRNYTHSLTGNSTRSCAQLMEIFIKELYPDVTVVRVHSDESNIFRYDENLNFVKSQLIPCIDAYRDAHARGEAYPDEIIDNLKDRYNEFNPDWKKSFHVTLSLSDGSPARTYAIQASLRPYRPTYFHVWQLKTFWHNTKVCDDDIEIHSYDEMEIAPATDVSFANKRVQSLVKEIKRFKHEFLIKMTQPNDITRFWLRKTKKPVLAVLLVEKRDGISKLYRGTNMEVSMPTGSLCAERNVIGTALAADPSLRREDLRMVGVLAVPLPDDLSVLSNNASLAKQLDTDSNTLMPQVCTKLGNESDKVPDNDIASPLIPNSLPNSPYAFVPNLPIRKRSISMSSFTSFVLEDDDATGVEDHRRNVDETQGFSAAGSTNDESLHNDLSNVSLLNHDATAACSATVVRRINLFNTDTEFENSYCKIVDDAPPQLARDTPRNNNFSKKKSKRTVIVHSNQDINPLKPCGACNEWLKKIAEYNPYFKVLTFTDADCNGVYITSCQE